MAKQRYINTKFWDDNFIINLDPIEKLLFLYFLTNPLTNISGIYEISIRRIAFDTGIDKDMVIKILERFEKWDKIKHLDGWIAIKNFIKHQNLNPKIKAGIEYELKDKPPELIKFSNVLDFKPVEKNKRQKISKGLRTKIFLKYESKCAFCGSIDKLEIDHIKPVSQGGDNSEDNLRVLCQSCNGKRNAGLRWENHRWVMGSLSHVNTNTNINNNTNQSSKAYNPDKAWNLCLEIAKAGGNGIKDLDPNIKAALQKAGGLTKLRLTSNSFELTKMKKDFSSLINGG